MLVRRAACVARYSESHIVVSPVSYSLFTLCAAFLNWTDRSHPPTIRYQYPYAHVASIAFEFTSQIDIMFNIMNSASQGSPSPTIIELISAGILSGVQDVIAQLGVTLNQSVFTVPLSSHSILNDNQMIIEMGALFVAFLPASAHNSYTAFNISEMLQNHVINYVRSKANFPEVEQIVSAQTLKVCFL